MNNNMYYYCFYYYAYLIFIYLMFLLIYLLHIYIYAQIYNINTCPLLLACSW